MTTFPDTTGAHDPKFAAMVDEVYQHLVVTLKEKMGWHDAANPELTMGDGHVLIRFERGGQRWVLRVPKHDVMQHKRNMLAYRHLGHLSLMPAKLYHDGKSLIEEHIDGTPFGSQVRDQVLIQLAQQLGAMHSTLVNGFGPLDFDLQGSFADAAAFFQAKRAFELDRSEMDISSEQEEVLNRAVAQAGRLPECLVATPVRLGHGDMWRNNVLITKDSFKIIDWDRIGAYPVERDLALLWVAKLSAAQRALFFSHYPHPVEPALLAWFAKRHVLRDTSLRLGNKAKKILEIEALLLP